MAWFSRRSWQDEMRDDVGHHLSALCREVAALSGDAGRRGHKLAERYGHQLQETAGQLQQSAGELGGALLHQGSVAAREIGRQAQRAGRAVRQDPVPAVATMVAIACIASLVFSRRR